MLGFAPLGGIPLGGGGRSVKIVAPPPTLNVVIYDGMGLHDSTPGVKWILNVLMPEGFGFSPDVVQGSHDPIFVTVPAGIGIAETLVSTYFKGAIVTEGFAISSLSVALVGEISLVINERFRVILTDIVQQGYNVLAADNLGVAASVISWYGLQVREILKVRGTLTVNQLIHLFLTDAAKFVDTVRQLFALEMHENLGVHQESTVQSALRMLEAVQISSTLGGAAAYNITMRQVMRLRDSLANFFGGEISEGIEVGSTLAARALAHAGIAEDVGIAASLTPKLLMSVVTREGVKVHPTDAIQMLFNPTMLEGVEMKAGYLGPDGSFTTWVMNTRSGGVTEYQDYVFNSFAQMGNKYLGASADGLYELLGDDDAGDPIIARMKGGYMQFGGTQLSRLKEAYIAARGEGDWVLKIITGDDVYNYAVSNRNMRSTKFHMGKGQRARYFAFELISAGQDFDLDTLEFVPLVVQRRV